MLNSRRPLEIMISESLSLRISRLLLLSLLGRGQVEIGSGTGNPSRAITIHGLLCMAERAVEQHGVRGPGGHWCGPGGVVNDKGSSAILDCFFPSSHQPRPVGGALSTVQ